MESILNRLVRYRLSQKWLISQLARHGIIINKAYLCRVLKGEFSKRSRAQLVIEACNAILDEFERDPYPDVGAVQTVESGGLMSAT